MMLMGVGPYGAAPEREMRAKARHAWEDLVRAAPAAVIPAVPGWRAVVVETTEDGLSVKEGAPLRLIEITDWALRFQQLYSELGSYGETLVPLPMNDGYILGEGGEAREGEGFVKTMVLALVPPGKTEADVIETMKKTGAAK